MDFLFFIAAACALIWIVWFLLRGSLVAGCTALVAVAACFGYWFWHTEGGFPLTADRAFLVLLVVTYGVRRALGAADPKPMGRADWVLFAFLAFLTFSTLSHDWHKVNSLPLAHLVLYWIMPAAVYWIARQSPLNERSVMGVFIGLALLEVYLIVTALAEGTGQWWAVFPQYISLPQHQFFGRARGPFLNPSAMGMYLTVGLIAALSFWPKLGRAGQLGLIAFLGLASAAIFATLTRSVWMGGLLALAIFLGLTLPRQWRSALISIGLAGSLLLVATNWDSLWNLKRDERLDAAAAAESAELRPLLARMAWNMFLDRPLFGCGFGQYDPERLPYLNDRTTDMPLAKTAPYAQHNSFLALLVETGLLGMGLFILLMMLWVRSAWRLWADSSLPLWMRQMGLLMLASIGAYLPNAMFQDTNIIDGFNLLLFFLAGVTCGLASQLSRVEVADRSRSNCRATTLESPIDSESRQLVQTS